MTHQSYMNDRLRVVQGDITRLEVDAIVNAANASLMGGGGVDGAIHRAAGPELQRACERVRERYWPQGLPVGEVALTDGFALPARRVIHTVGPVYERSEDRSQALADCYRRALDLAREANMRHIAFPAISTGVYGYPFEAACEVVLGVMADALTDNAPLVTLCFLSHEEVSRLEAVAARLGYAPD